VAVLAAFCSALLEKPLRGGLAVAGNVTLGGSLEPIHNPVDVVELALAKGAANLLMPVACRKALIELSDEAATKVQILFYADVADALRKALAD
jgi:ATP-dependent Lon protease